MSSNVRIPPNPCKRDCERRRPGCSATCVDSIIWHKALEQRKAELRVEKAADYILGFKNFYKRRK